MHLLGAVDLARLAGAPVHGVIAGHGLPGTCGGQHWQKEGEVLQAGEHLLNTDQHHMDTGQGSRESGIPLILGDGDHACLRHGEICAADSHIGLAIFSSHHIARNHGQLLRFIGGSGAEFLLEEIADLPPREMHGGEYQMERRLLAELDDVLAKIGFKDPVAFLLQRIVEVNLLAGHRL